MAIADPEARQLNVFLRRHRQRIDPHVRVLGDHERLPTRRGRPVTQEEMAEAVGVSRVWYSLLETGSTIRTSTKVLERLAVVLMLDAPERARLFHLAMPELGPLEVGAESALVLESFAVVRAAMRRLWSATTEVEALETVAEQVAAVVDDADLVFYVRRLREGEWEWPYVLDRGMGQHNREAYAAATSRMTPAEVDEFLFYPQLSLAGDVGTPDVYTSKTVRAAYRGIFCDPKLNLGTLLHARVRSRSGLIGGFTVKHLGEHDYSVEQRAIMSTLAELTSVALS
ncbi:MAG TPA: helix-turn-helix transcriptional regulator [Candidatus Sulfotelmatobacter sp.]|nr:helix-turn-helix transcriptional regulator [Candidatus Sulfotelmatobacter sp.]